MSRKMLSKVFSRSNPDSYSLGKPTTSENKPQEIKEVHVKEEKSFTPPQSNPFDEQREWNLPILTSAS